MTNTENKDLIVRYLKAINGNVKTPQLSDVFIAESDAALKQHIAVAEAAFPRYALEPEDIFAEGDKVLVRFTLRGTHQGDFMGIPPTGRVVAVPGLIVYRIANGMIAEHWMHMDNMALMQRLGVASQPA
jgi:predicted ester cyclase